VVDGQAERDMEGPMATKTIEEWRTADTNELIEAILRLETPDEAARFLRDLCTLGELRDLAQRWSVVRRLEAGEHYAAISRETGASTATITRIASWLNHGEGGYREALIRLVAAREAGIPYPAGNET
jgi:TrpR-related protein YerC/YecD